MRILLLALDPVEELLLRYVFEVLLELFGKRGTVPLLVEVGFVVNLLVEVPHLGDIFPVNHLYPSLFRLLRCRKQILAFVAGDASVPVVAELERGRLSNPSAN
jgi:hypothetical protein